MADDGKRARDVLDDDAPVLTKRSNRGESQMTCPYMDTIDRHALDFDFEKVCSVSNVPNNVYACLVCGKYFAGGLCALWLTLIRIGRGLSTPAFQHCLESSHHVFMKTSDGKVYCLPDNYQVLDASLQDIRVRLGAGPAS